MIEQIYSNKFEKSVSEDTSSYNLPIEGGVNTKINQLISEDKETQNFDEMYMRTFGLACRSLCKNNNGRDIWKRKFYKRNNMDV